MSEQQPKNLSEALLSIIWKKGGSKKTITIVIFAICAAAFIIWNSLPDKEKSKLLSLKSISVEDLVVGSNEDNNKIEF